MDIASLLLNTPSLTDYLYGGERNTRSHTDLSNFQSSNLAAQLTQNAAAAQGSAVQISLSPEAQRILNEQSQAENSGKQIEGAQQHFLQFFEDNGVDLANLSFGAQELLGSIYEVIEQTESAQRDTYLDNLEREASNGKRQVYTLLSEGRRFRIAVEEQKDGQQKLIVTDLHENKADVAEITLTEDDEQNIVINVDRRQEVFAHTRKISIEDQGTMTIKTASLP